MKFIVNSEYLLKQLTLLNGVITTNPVVPILENFLFEVDQNLLLVTASDIQTSIKAEIEVNSNEKGKIAVPARLVLETLKYLPDQPVTFTLDESTYSMEISSDNGRYKLSCENATDFPKTPLISNQQSTSISSDLLSRAISYTIFATSSDELRPSMTGVYINLGSESTTFVSTDGHRLVRYSRTDIKSNLQSSIIIPRKALNLLRSTLPSQNTDVSLDFNASNAIFSFSNIQMICRLIDEKFPDYQNVIPKESKIVMQISRDAMLTSLKRISIYSNKTTNQIRVNIVGSDLKISAEDLDFNNEANEHLSCEHTGEDIEIGFNGRYFLEFLNNIDGDFVEVKMNSPSTAAVIIPKEKIKNEDVLMLMTPVMLSQYV